MPTVNNLMSGNGPTPVKPALTPPANPTIALAPGAQSALANPVANVGDVSTRPVGAYIGNAHPMSKNWPTVNAVGVGEGDFYIDGAGEIKRLMPFNYWVYAVEGFGTVMDAAGNVVRATDDKELIKDQQRLKAAGYDEHFCCVVFADLGDRIVPAKADFRTTKSNAAKVPILMLREAGEPGWVDKSGEHKLSAAFPHVFGRCYFSATTAKGTVRSGNAAGKPYFAARVTGRPTTVGEMQRLAEALAADGFVDLVNQAWSTFAARVEQIRAAIGK